MMNHDATSCAPVLLFILFLHCFLGYRRRGTFRDLDVIAVHPAGKEKHSFLLIFTTVDIALYIERVYVVMRSY